MVPVELMNYAKEKYYVASFAKLYHEAIVIEQYKYKKAKSQRSYCLLSEFWMVDNIYSNIDKESLAAVLYWKKSESKGN